MSTTQEKTSAGATQTPPAGGGGGGGVKETKVVETTDYRTSAGQGQQEQRPVQVVHENPTEGNDARGKAGQREL
ncbi:unnamed protein product [Musa acuminata subsp. malaccensis]|uniref:(wild Malaysian banana) hypothetical protein n=1 Tax=Musa acuminata subsp. malaccensis TaxID=214687 RepID=A0A804HNQ8_MUSAM|nr:unnamed protein product [Musa acuminata subsp. malaccensis]